MLDIYAAADRVDITLTQGDDDTFTITKKDKQGNEQDITGWTFWLTVKEDLSVDDANAEIQKKITNHTEPTSGKTSIPLLSSDTEDLEGKYWYDMQLKDDTGAVKTFIYGTIYFQQDVTNTTQ